MEKFNNHGLEAINRGIKFALDDFDDDEELEGQISGKVNHGMSTPEYLQWTQLFNPCPPSSKPNRDIMDFRKTLRETLKIKSITNYKNIDLEEIRFYTYCIIARGDVKGVSNISKEEKKEINSETESDFNWMLTLAKHISIILVDDQNMPKSPIKGEYSTESLGCYFSLGQFDYPQPSIFLCPQRITEAAKSKDIDEKVLFAKVLIHELAHAIMDPTNIFEYGTLKPKVSEQKLVSDADVFMEESLANMITLQYFDAAKDINDVNDFEQVKSFMEKQPEAYKFGIEQFQLCTDWREWRNNKSSMKFWMYFYSNLQSIWKN